MQQFACAVVARGGSIAFVTALQERYTLKKTASSASVGVGAFGTFSVPFGSSDDALVKVASETITAGDFYGRFFALVAHYLVPGADAAPQGGRPGPRRPVATGTPRPSE
jgi:hypothetical protein